MVTIGIATIAHWKIAGLMSWEAIAAGVVPTRISSLRRHNLKVQKSTALSRNRQSPRAEDIAQGLVRPNADRLCGSLLPAPAEQTECAEVGGEQRQCRGQRHRRCSQCFCC